MFQDNSPISVKEARKLLGKKYKKLSDASVEVIISLLETIARDSIQDTVPDFS